MRVGGLAAVVALIVAGCGGGSSHNPSHSPTPAAPSATATTPAPPIPSGSPGPTNAVHCATPVSAGDNLVIGTVVGDPTVVLRDIQDPANAKNVCTFDPNLSGIQFVSASTVVYMTTDRQIVEAPVAGGPTTLMANLGAAGPFAVSPDGRSLTYLDQNDWHLVTAGGNRLLTTLPPVPGRGVNPDEDDTFLGFSPDGLYIALFQTFHTGGSGETAPDQIRRASDGKLVYSTSGMTMAVWASVPSRLYFRDASGGMHRWDPSAGLSAMTTLHWIRPKSSPDGRWIAYTFRTSTGLGGVGFYSVQSNSVQNTTPPGRSGVFFLTTDLVWYIGEKPCTTNCGPGVATQPTGVTYIYSVAGASEVTSRLAFVYDAWPKVTAPGL